MLTRFVNYPFRRSRHAFGIELLDNHRTCLLSDTLGRMVLPVVTEATDVAADLREALLRHVPSVRPDHLSCYATLIPMLSAFKATEALVVETDDLTVACRDLSNIHIHTNRLPIIKTMYVLSRDLVQHHGIPLPTFTFDRHRTGFAVTVRVFTFAGETEPAKFL